jgi:gliding motility-associated-like protein
MMLKSKLFFFFSFVYSFSWCTHIKGGTISYLSLGNNVYRISIEIFRDCHSQSDFDAPLYYTVFDGENVANYSQHSVFYSEKSPLVYAPNPCVELKDTACIERAVYIDTVLLLPNIGGYTISYQRCCWTPEIENIFEPEENGMTLTTFVPGTNLIAGQNSAPQFKWLPPLVICANKPFLFDYSAFDKDNDSLVYSLVDPFDGGSATSTNASADPESPPPYAVLGWTSGYSTTQPFGASSSVAIDPMTGLLAIMPSSTGEYISAVLVQEYRNGLLLSAETRTFVFQVAECDSIDPYSVTIQGATKLVEECGSSSVLITRVDASDKATISVLFQGNATHPSDYSFPDTIFLEVGVDTLVVPFLPILDKVVEGAETAILYIIIKNNCTELMDTIILNFIIQDYQPMILSFQDSINVCDETDSQAGLSLKVVNGQPPFYYNWEPGFFPNQSSISIPTQHLKAGRNDFSIEIVDQCGKSIVRGPISIYNECVLTAPNVITANGDHVNDFFLINNLEDYEAVELVILNRWGEIVFENSKYDNKWGGNHKNGSLLSAGVYFYKITPSSFKYSYPHHGKEKKSIHGFIEVLR